MAKPNVDKITTALQGKRLTRGKLWNRRSDCGCALGQLLVTAGVPKKELYDVGMPSVDHRVLLADEYGLVWDEASWLMHRNDDSNTRTNLARGEQVIEMAKRRWGNGQG